MMGATARTVTARHAVSLEGLVPPDDVYRHLDRVFDLAFVRDLVRDTYAPRGDGPGAAEALALIGFALLQQGDPAAGRPRGA